MLEKESLVEILEDRKNIALTWIIFFVLPLFAFLISLRNYKCREYRIFILLFGVLYGFTFIPIVPSDGSKYAKKFEEIERYDWNEYVYDVTHILKAGAENPDLYGYTIFFITSKFSKDAKFFFMVAGLVYFLVFLRLISSIYDLTEGIKGKYYFWFFLGCVFIVNFSLGMNGIRFPLAFMVFSYGALKLVITNEIKYLGIALLSPFIHFMFVFPALFLMLYRFVPFSRNHAFLLIFLFLAMFFGRIFHSYIFNNASIFGDPFEARLEGYTSDAWIEARENHVTEWNWYVRFRLYSSYYFSVLALIIAWIWKRKFCQNDISERLFVLALLMTIVSFITGSLVDALSNRFTSLAELFTLILLFYLAYINKHSALLKILSWIYIPVFIIKALVIFRADLYTVSPYLIFGNPILMLLYESSVSLQELILG